MVCSGLDICVVAGTLIRSAHYFSLLFWYFSRMTMSNINDDVIKWEHFPRYWLLALCVRNSTVTGEFPSQRPVTRSFDVFFDLHLNKRMSKQSWGWWFETPSRSFWRHCNGSQYHLLIFTVRIKLELYMFVKIFFKFVHDRKSNPKDTLKSNQTGYKQIASIYRYI